MSKMADDDPWLLKEDGCLNVDTECKSIIYHANLNVLLITTGSAQVYVFDVNSGVILQRSSLSGEHAAPRRRIDPLEGGSPSRVDAGGTAGHPVGAPSTSPSRLSDVCGILCNNASRVKVVHVSQVHDRAATHPPPRWDFPGRGAASKRQPLSLFPPPGSRGDVSESILFRLRFSRLPAISLAPLFRVARK